MCYFRFFLNIPNSVFPRCPCVYTRQAGRKPALQQNWQSSEKSQHFKEKTQFLMNTLYMNVCIFLSNFAIDTSRKIYKCSDRRMEVLLPAHLEIYDSHTNRPINRPTDRTKGQDKLGHREVTLPQKLCICTFEINYTLPSEWMKTNIGLFLCIYELKIQNLQKVQARK